MVNEGFMVIANQRIICTNLDIETKSHEDERNIENLSNSLADTVSSSNAEPPIKRHKSDHHPSNLCQYEKSEILCPVLSIKQRFSC